jgi:hypothetical protein
MDNQHLSYRVFPESKGMVPRKGDVISMFFSQKTPFAILLDNDSFLLTGNQIPLKILLIFRPNSPYYIKVPASAIDACPAEQCVRHFFIRAIKTSHTAATLCTMEAGIF